MDRHNSLHKASRVTLPQSVSCVADADSLESNAMLHPSRPMIGVRSNVANVLARVGLFTCSLAVIATASLLAFWVR